MSRPRRRRRAAAAAGLGLALLAGACGSAGDAGRAAATTTGDPRWAPAGEVVMRDRRFVPDELTVPAGGTVTWSNEDEVEHWVVGLDPNVLDSGQMGQDSAYSRPFPRPGTYRYYCKIHNEMKGTVTVA